METLFRLDFCNSVFSSRAEICSAEKQIFACHRRRRRRFDRVKVRFPSQRHLPRDRGAPLRQPLSWA